MSCKIFALFFGAVRPIAGSLLVAGALFCSGLMSGHAQTVDAVLDFIDISAMDLSQEGDRHRDTLYEIADLLRKHGGKTVTELGVTWLRNHQSAPGKFHINGKSGLKYEVLYSSDLKDWQVLDTITSQEDSEEYVDQTITKQGSRFYKIRYVE